MEKAKNLLYVQDGEKKTQNKSNLMGNFLQLNLKPPFMDASKIMGNTSSCNQVPTIPNNIENQPKNIVPMNGSQKKFVLSQISTQEGSNQQVSIFSLKNNAQPTQHSGLSQIMLPNNQINDLFKKKEEKKGEEGKDAMLLENRKMISEKKIPPSVTEDKRHIFNPAQ